MTLPPPILGADPLRPPNAEQLAGDPILEGYGAPAPGDDAGEAAGIPVGPAEVTAVLVGLFDGLATIRGPHWHAEPQEFAMAAPRLALYLSQPDTSVAAWLAAHGDQLLIVVGLGAVVVPRAMIEYQVIRRRRDELRRELEAAAIAQQEHAGGYRPLTPQPHAGAGAYAGGAADDAPPGGAGGDLSAAGWQEPAMGRETDPGSLAASVGGILGG